MWLENRRISLTMIRSTHMIVDGKLSRIITYLVFSNKRTQSSRRTVS